MVHLQKCLFMHSNSHSADEHTGFGSEFNRNHNNWVPMQREPLGGPASGYGGQFNLSNRNCAMNGNMFTAPKSYFGNYSGNQHDLQHQPNHAGSSFGQYYHNNGSPGLDESQNRNRKKLCRNGPICNAHGCDFHHSIIQKQCRNGNDCANKERTCLFLHESKNE